MTRFHRLAPLVLGLAGLARADLIVLHTNDTHGQLYPTPAPEDLGGYARRASMVRALRAEAAAAGDEVLLLDAGDINTGTFESDKALGLADVRAMNAMGYDAAVIGNHEFDLRPAEQRAFVAAADFPMLSANVRHRLRRKFAPWLAVERGGSRTLVVGLTTPDSPTTSTFARDYGWRFHDPVDALEWVLSRHAKKFDHVVVLSHLGREGDLELIEKFRGRVQAIVGGHTHFQEILTPEPGMIYSRTGAKGRWVGRFRLTFEGGRLVARDPEVLPVDSSWPEDPAVAAALPPVGVGEPVAEAPDEISRQGLDGPGTSSVMGNFYTDLLRRHAGTDVAVANKAGLRVGLAAGPVTDKRLYEVCPFKNKTYVFELTGRQLEAVYRDCIRLGVPGPGFLETSGATVTQGPGDALDIRVGGAPVSPAAEYTLAVSDFLAKGGDGYKVFEGFGAPARVLPESPAEFLREQAAAAGILRADRAVRVRLTENGGPDSHKKRRGGRHKH